MTESYIIKNEIKSEADELLVDKVKTVEVYTKQEDELEKIEDIEIETREWSPVENIYDGQEVKEETEIIPQVQRSVWDDDVSDECDNDEIAPGTIDIFKLIDQFSTQCITCKTKFFTQDEKINSCHTCLRRDRIKNRNEEYICDICKKGYKFKYALVQHIIKHGQEKFKVKKVKKKKIPTEYTFECEICNKRFLYKCRLKRHMISHYRLKHFKSFKPFKCGKCNKKFARKGFLANHMTVHYAFKRYSCKICGVDFSKEIPCQTHIRRQHKDKISKEKKYQDLIQIVNEDPGSWIEYEKQKYACNTCSKIFYEKSSLINHLKELCLNKQFSCTICDRSFTKKKKLDVHMFVHTGERKHVCCICNKSYTGLSGLQNHKLLKHSTARPHKCNSCNSSFITRPQLKHHVLSKHTQQPQFSCGVCKQKFRHSVSLRKHMIVHTGGFSYACDYCNRSYILKSGLMAHIKEKHGL